MDVIGGFWHLMNFLAPAVATGLIASLAAKVLWRREMTAASVWRLWRWSSGLSLLAALVGLVVFGRDGKIATYAAMVLSGAVGLWWAGFSRRQ